MHTLAGQVTQLVVVPTSGWMAYTMLTARTGGHLPIMMRSAMDRVTFGKESTLPPFAHIQSTQGRVRTIVTLIAYKTTLQIRIGQPLIQTKVAKKNQTTNTTQPAVLAIKKDEMKVVMIVEVIVMVQYVYLTMHKYIKQPLGESQLV